METIIEIITFVLVLVYAGFAVRFICTRQTIAKSLISSAFLIAGGLVAVPVAEAISALVCYLFITVFVLALLGAMFGG